jgi:hypothetical protein
MQSVASLAADGVCHRYHYHYYSGQKKGLTNESLVPSPFSTILIIILLGISVLHAAKYRCDESNHGHVTSRSPSRVIFEENCEMRYF